MASKPNFFIVRPDTKQTTADGTVHIVPGPIVPLVAVDELPEWFRIVEVPRELAVEQTVGLCNLGTASKGKDTYTVKIIHQAPPVARGQTVVVNSAETKQEKTANSPHHAHPADHPSTAAPTASAQVTTSTPHPADRMRAHWSDSPAGIASSIHNPQPPSQVQQPPPYSVQTPPTTAAVATNNAPTTPITTAIITNTPNNNSTTSPFEAKTQTNTTRTEYCRHWCHHGTCKWGLHCRHLHAMPTTPAALAAVGLRGVPAWWVATVARTGTGQLAHHRGGQHHQHHAYRAGQHQHQHLQAQQGYLHSRDGHVLSHVHVDGDGVGTERVASMDPRDVRAGVMVRQVAATSSAPSSSTTSNSSNNNSRTWIHPTPLGGHGQGMSRKKVVRALLRELGLTVGTGGGGGGSGRFVLAPPRGGGKPRKREVNPLEKGRRENREEKEVLVRAARADMAVAAATAAATAGAAGVLGIGGGVGQGQRAVVETVRGKGGDLGGGKVVGGVQEVIVQSVGKLVDV